MKTKFLFLLLLFYSAIIIAQDTYKTRILFYNTENLFDTFNDTLKNDDDFTPASLRKWTFSRYYKKLNNISKVIIAAGGWDAPGIIGLSEVENKMVLLELIHKTPLKKFDYSIVHYDSPEERGMDVAMLYKPEVLKVIRSKPLRIKFPFDSLLKTRDILYVKGLIFNSDTVHFFVNHFPSRRDGQEVSEIRRLYVASVLKEKVDSIRKANINANIVIMGDFNDEPSDKTISVVLSAKSDTSHLMADDLFNLMSTAKKNNEWTYSYKYLFMLQRLVFDQFIVSPNILNPNNHFYLQHLYAEIFKPEWLLTKTSDGNQIPFSTYYGPRYLGGFSDHLPVFIDLLYSGKY